MSPSRGVRWSALLILMAVLAGPIPASAQWLYDEAAAPLEPNPDLLLRSPRLLGLGQMTFVLDDVHHRINFWELGHNPVGIIRADSASVLEFGLATRAASSLADQLGLPARIERQDLAAHEMRAYYEGWRRNATTTYGAYGDFSTFQIDHPYDVDRERRSRYERPDITAILAGRLPLVKTERLSYGLRVRVTSESNSHVYRLVVRNANGIYIDKDGTQVGPPDFFQPTEINSSTLGVGLAFGYVLSRALQMAVAYDFQQLEIHGENIGFRNQSEVRDERPYGIGQVTVGGTMSNLEWGVDARGWNASSDQTFVFTTSAGVATEPLAGRGALLGRDEEGSAVRARARWRQGALEIGAGASTGYRQVQITPPDPGRIDTFNHFLNLVFHRISADSLALPDSIVRSTHEERSFQAGGGIAIHALGEATVIGIEGRAYRTVNSSDLAGEGPRVKGWSLNGGAEIRPLRDLAVRAGYVFRREDQDQLTEQNEFVSHALTAGLGLSPGGARWGLDAGYSFEWIGPDYNDPSDPRATRQRLATRLRWLF